MTRGMTDLERAARLLLAVDQLMEARTGDVVLAAGLHFVRLVASEGARARRALRCPTRRLLELPLELVDEPSLGLHARRGGGECLVGLLGLVPAQLEDLLERETELLSSHSLSFFPAEAGLASQRRVRLEPRDGP